MPHLNAQFLAAIDSSTRSAVLESIAVHYGVSVEEAYAEVTGDRSEHLLDYITEPLRSATSALMQRHGMRGW